MRLVVEDFEGRSFASTEAELEVLLGRRHAPHDANCVWLTRADAEGGYPVMAILLRGERAQVTYFS